MGRVREQGVKEEGWLLNRYLFRLKRKDTTISYEATETLMVAQYFNVPNPLKSSGGNMWRTTLVRSV